MASLKNISIKMTRNGLKGYIGTKQEGQFEYCEWSALQWMAEQLAEGAVVAESSYYSAAQVAAHTAKQ